MKIEYDKKLDIMYIRFKEGTYAFSEELNENAIIDIDENGRMLAIELLDISKVFGLELLKKMLKAEAAVIT